MTVPRRTSYPHGLLFDPADAVRHLTGADPALALLIQRSGPFLMRPTRTQSLFAALLEAIVYQQLTGRAAETILGRVHGLFAPRRYPRAEDLLLLSESKLRSAGLSRNKAAALRDLARRVIDGTVPPLRAARRMSDEELIERLTTVRGIGRWTAEMYLMFQLRRLDVWPVDDLGVRQGYALAWQLEPAPTPKQLDPLGDRFRPYRSIVARYCWAAVPLLRPGGTAASLR